MKGRQAQLICQDPPWNIAVKSIVGSGRTNHREFVMGSGEMSVAEFRQFLRDELRCNVKHAVPGAVFQSSSHLSFSSSDQHEFSARLFLRIR